MLRRYLLVGLVSLFPAWAYAGCTNPVAAADTVDNYGSTLVVDVLANDSDADGDALAVTVTNNGCSGATVALSGSLLRVEPNGFPSATCSIHYRITDVTGRTANSQVNLVPVQLGIFADGFETASTARWSQTCPGSC